MTLYMVELTVSDLTRSVAWYRDCLGMVLTRLDDPNGFALLEASTGGRVALKQGTPPLVGGVRLHFVVPDLTAELDRLAALGVYPESDLKTSDEGYRRAAFRDPDGYAVTLFEWLPTSSPVPSRP